MNYNTIKLGKLVESVSERGFEKLSKVVLINTSDILKGKVLNREKTENKNLKGQFKKTFKYGDILFSEIRPINKRYAKIDFDAHGYVASTKLMVIRRKTDIIENDYLYYILTNLQTLRKLQNQAESRSGTFPQITFKNISELEIRLPQRLCQRKIVSIANSFDKKFENNNKIITNLEEQVQAIFKSWFVNFDPFQDGVFVESELGLIPKGWEVRILKDDLDFIRGVEPGSKNYKTEKGESNIKFYRVGEMLTDTEIYVDEGLVGDKLAKKDDVLVSFDGTVGRVAIGLEGSYSTGIRNIKAKKDKYYPKSFIYVLANSKYMQEKIREHATGTTILHASKAIDYMSIPYDLRTVKEVTKILDPMFNLILNKKLENIKLAELRDTLLPKLMSGEIDVSNIGLDKEEF